METYEIIILSLTIFSGFLVVYHHVLFPFFLMRLSKNRKSAANDSYDTTNLPSVTIIIPAYNEGDYIADKLYNVASLSYPKEKLNVVLYCDGCTDDTYENAKIASEMAICEDLNIQIQNELSNIGKTKAINKLAAKVSTDIVALSDVSALISIDALYVAAEHFKDPAIGVVAGTYNFLETTNEGEKTYWSYQTRIKQGESVLGGPIGAHGAFYMFRKDVFVPLSEETINDDFVLPIKIMMNGYNAVYETNIMALELEAADNDMDYNRRCRLAEGNVQQVMQMRKILHPKYKGIALSFLSGKVLRAFTPILLIICLIGSFILSFSDVALLQSLFLIGFLVQSVAYGLSLYKAYNTKHASHKVFEIIYYIVSGHFAGLIGFYRYIKNNYFSKKKSYTHSIVNISKRIFDIVFALVGLTVSIFMFPLLAIAIKLDSKGPIIFKQIRIGLSDDHSTKLFYLYKFRSMVVDAEKGTGAVWAQKNDPRVTRVGKFLRKTRLDELPQLVNVLIGEMAIIGPRPERPGITGDLNNQIPFFAERTYGVRPGITGLAQVYNGYDETIDDARQKAAYDHAYAVTLSNPLAWALMDLKIIFKTIQVVVGARGQ